MNKAVRFSIAVFFVFVSVVLNAQKVEWANEVREVSSQRDLKRYSAAQALGKPNVLPQGGESACAWEPLKESNKKGEFLYVRFANPLFTKQVVVAESRNPGSIYQIDFINTSGNVITVYKNEEIKDLDERNRLFSFVLEETTKYKVKGVKIYLQTNDVRGYNAIDAVGISETDQPIEIKVNLAENAKFDNGPENLGNGINSAYYEFLPQISPDGKTLYYTRRFHPENTGFKSSNEATNNADDDIWFSELKGNTWSQAVKMPDPLNNDFPNSAYTITPDGNSLLLANIYNKNAPPAQGVSYAYKRTNGWSFPQGLMINGFYNLGPYSEFFLGTSKKVLLMTLVREEGSGDNDVYVSFLNKDKTWTQPKNLGTVLNTAGVESSPFLAADGVTLYYSSDGFSGYGKRDLYVTKRLDDTWTKWSEPINLGSAINSEENESYYSVPASGEYAYFVSSKQSLGNSDIFRIKLPNAIKPAPVSLISGRAINKVTGLPAGEEVEIEYEILPEGLEVGVARTNPATGEFKIALPHDHLYAFRATAEGFIGVNQRIDLREELHKSYEEIVLDLELIPIEVGQKVLLRNVGFAQGKPDLEPYSNPELDRLVDLLKSKSTLIIRLEGHTETKGFQDWNLKLSEERVVVVKNYLIAKGVRASQIEAKGFGGSKPMYTDEANSELNRRVEYEILAK